MSVLLSCQDLTKSYSDRPLFREISFGIAEGERVGLFGPNGSGKSTMLKILGGREKPDSGAVALRRGVRLGYVPQEETLPGERTVREVLAGALADTGMDPHERDVLVEIMLAQAGFPQPDQPAGQLSGGWRKRLAIARELVREPDLLLLDEPTNHLDLEGIVWLEEILRGARFAFLVVSHDRRLLEKVPTRVMELNRTYAEGYLSINGGYNTFLTAREAYLRDLENQQIALSNKVRKEVEWLGKTAQARSTKANYRIKEAGRLMDDLAEVRFRSQQNRAAEIDFTASRRKTKELVVAKSIDKTMGDRRLFSRLDLILSPGMKLGLLGPNGSGKSTLLKILAGETQPDAGTVTHADGLRVVYFDQQREQLDKNLPLKHTISPTGENVIYRDNPMHINAWAKRFLFLPEQLEMPVGYLSGGEQARALVARLMLRPADLLILDEPTNDLDIPTLEVLEESLNEFPGAMLLVTHDREMLDRLSTELLALDGKGGAFFLADYAQWERMEERRLQQEAEQARPTLSAAPKPAVARLTTAERRELDKMEERIEQAEGEVARLEALVADPTVAADHIKLQETWNATLAAKERVAQLYARWEELEEKKAASGG